MSKKQTQHGGDGGEKWEVGEVNFADAARFAHPHSAARILLMPPPIRATSITKLLASVAILLRSNHIQSVSDGDE